MRSDSRRGGRDASQGTDMETNPPGIVLDRSTTCSHDCENGGVAIMSTSGQNNSLTEGLSPATERVFISVYQRPNEDG